MASTLRRFGHWFNEFTKEPVVFFILITAVVLVSWLVWPKTYTAARVLPDGGCYEVKVTESFGGLVEKREIVGVYRSTNPCR